MARKRKKVRAARSRPHAFFLWLSEAELEQFTRVSTAMGKNRSDVLRALITRAAEGVEQKDFSSRSGRMTTREMETAVLMTNAQRARSLSLLGLANQKPAAQEKPPAPSVNT